MKWTVLFIWITAAAGCAKNVEAESSADAAEVGPADVLRVRVKGSTSWTAIKAVCGDFSAAFPLEGDEARATGLPAGDCFVEMMPGATRAISHVNIGHSYTCEPATGGGADCADDYADALLVRVVGGDFKSIHVECPKAGFDKRAVLENGSAVLHGLTGSCVLSLNPGEVPSDLAPVRGQRVTCHADGSRISDCATQ